MKIGTNGTGLKIAPTMAHRFKRGDAMAIVLAAAIISSLTLASVVLPGRHTNRPFNYGFGSNIECHHVPFGGPICFRKS
jgi:hypothetical protein